MVRIAVIQFLLISGIFSDVCFGESAWQIELLGKAETDAAVVRLGDVGLVHGLPPHEAQVLNRIVLTPGPRPTVRRSLSATQVRKMLQGRGVDLTGCQMIGAARTVVCFKAHAATDTEPDTAGVKQAETSPWDVVRPASYRTREGMRVVKNTEEQLAEAVREKLSELSGDESVWHVTIAVEPRGLKAISADWESVSVDGLSIASEGRHRLVAHFLSNAGNSQLAFEAVVVRQVQMVVPTRPLRRGETISASDIELQHVIGESLQQTSATSETEVVGRQVQTPLRAGEPIPLAALKQPILVQRREQIDVVARRGGIQILEKVQSLDQGALGEVITVERLDGSKTRFVARVTGVQQAEVCVSNASTTRIAPRPVRR